MLDGKGSVSGQGHGRRRALPDLALDAKRAAVQLDQRAGDGDAQPAAPLCSGARLLTPEKALANVWQILGWDADPPISDVELHRS